MNSPASHYTKLVEASIFYIVYIIHIRHYFIYLGQIEPEQNHGNYITKESFKQQIRQFGFPLISILFLFIISIALTVKVSRGWKIPSSTHLAYSSDVIDCQDFTNSLQHLLYDKVIVTEKKLDSDNSATEIKIFSIFQDKINYHFESQIGTSTVNSHDSTPFLIPDAYFNRPWYLRKNSNITFEVTFNFEDPPSKAQLYLFNNEFDMNSFLKDPRGIPRYVQKLDLLTDELVFSITENSYYYVVADIQTEHKLYFSVEVKFNIKYIDADDYQDAYRMTLGQDGDTAKVPIDVDGKKRVLCSVSPLPDGSDDLPSTHVVLTYSVRQPTVIVVIFIFIFINTLCALIVCLCNYTLCKFCCSSQYELIH